MKVRFRSRISGAIIVGGMVHTIGMLILWALVFSNEYSDQDAVYRWYIMYPVIIYIVSLILTESLGALYDQGRLGGDTYESIIAFIYVTACCLDYIILRRFELSFLILMLPIIMVLLERRSSRKITYVLVLVIIYTLTLFLPSRLPGEPVRELAQRADEVFGIYISACVMFLLWETKDAYAISFRDKEESEFKMKTYRDFILKKNRDVREAAHNVKGTAEMILRHNVSDVSAGHVMEVMKAADNVVERVDMILELSRLELEMKNAPSIRNSLGEGSSKDPEDGSFLYAPNAYILVADDSVEALNLCRALLLRTGIRLDTVLSGAEALKMMSYNFYNLVILDHLLPDMSAIDLMHAMKEGRGINIDTPVVLCTTNDQEFVRGMYIAEGFCDVISKPMSGSRLEAVIARHLPPYLVSRKEAAHDNNT